jgi:hypothetical protein
LISFTREKPTAPLNHPYDMINFSGRRDRCFNPIPHYKDLNKPMLLSISFTRKKLTAPLNPPYYTINCS